MKVTILLTVLICLILVVAASWLAVHLSKRNINGTTVLGKIDTGLGYAMSIAEAVKPFIPTMAGNIIEAVLKYGEKAVTQAEATYKAALSTNAAATDTRKATATSMIKSALALEGIQMTADTQKLIDAVIPLLVMALPKTHEVAVQ